MVQNTNAIYNTVGNTISGVTNTFSVTNQSNTASSAARETITVGGTSAGNPTLNFNAGASNWETGLDNGDAQAYKISQSTALGTKDTFIMTTAGQRTMPLQPAFRATLSATQSNVTGDGTQYVPIFDTVAFDQNSNYNNSTGTFTAPVTGIYLFSIGVVFGNLSTANNGVNIQFTVNGAVAYLFDRCGIGTIKDANSFAGFTGTTLINLTAGNTVTGQVGVNGGTKTVSVGPRLGQENFFCGCLVC